MGSTDTEKKAMAAAFFACFVFGLSFVFSKLALAVVTPAMLLTYRFVLAFLLMNFMLLTGKRKLHLKGKKLWPLLLLGLLQPVVYFFCENYGIQLTTATFSAVMIALIPIATLLGGVFFLREIPTLAQTIFLILSVSGVTIMSILKGGDGTITALGVALLLIAVIAQAAYMALTRKFSASYSVFERTYVMFAVGCCVFLPVSLVQLHFDVSALVTALTVPQVAMATLFLGAACSFGAFLCLNYANTHLPVARTTAFANITTVVSVFAGAVLLKESFTPMTFVSAGMIVVGVWGVQHYVRVR